ncbi:MAG: hypothetical protein FWF86_00455 [Clostridia bacterium]|nr:hypothetical protein [Clostridia bacterium]
MRKIGMNRKLLTLVLALSVGFAMAWGRRPARAEECFIMSVDSLDMSMLNNNDYVARYLSADTLGLRVEKFISDSNELAAPVRLTLVQMDTQNLIYDKFYGYMGGTFDSGVIYLPYAGNATIPYLVTLTIADWVYAIPFMRLEPRLKDNRACTYGVRMRDFNPGLTDDWLMGTMVDLDDLRAQGGMSVPVYASDAFVVGEAALSLRENGLTVTLAFYASAEVELYGYHLYCVRDVGNLLTADPARMAERSYGAGEVIDVTGASTVLIYLSMSLSYNSAGLPSGGYDPGSSDARRQLALWERNLLQSSEYGYPEDEPAEVAEPAEPEWPEQSDVTEWPPAGAEEIRWEEAAQHEPADEPEDGDTVP